MKHQDGQSPNGSFEQLRILSSWQGLTPCLFSWIAIFVSITAAEQWPSVYPLAILVIANRIFALFLLSHEAVHVLLTPHRALNDFVGRYLCAFPIGVSFQQWRSKHLLHHRFLGSGLDLDLPIYSELFRTWPSYLRLFFSGKVSLILLIYFTPLDHILNRFGFKIPNLSAPPTMPGGRSRNNALPSHHPTPPINSPILPARPNRPATRPKMPIGATSMSSIQVNCSAWPPPQNRIS